jgi:serine/threonine protein kinase
LENEISVPGYVLIKLLGRGAYGEVFQAVKIGAGQDVAVKVFTSPGKLDWRYLQREVDRLLRVAEHPHIVTLFDADMQSTPPFYAMTFLRSGSLAEICSSGKRMEDVRQAAEWFEQIVSALEFAHAKGLLHCDLKPANVLLDEEGKIRLVDFGQSQLRGEAANALGTLSFMAPEQAVVAQEHEAPPDPSVSWDIYGVGATMYALLTGGAPHSSKDFQVTLTEIEGVAQRLDRYREHVRKTPILPIRGINSAVDKDLAEIVEHCLRPDPRERYHSIGALAADLKRRHQSRPLRCHPRKWGYRTAKFVRRNSGMVVIALVALLSLATSLVTLGIQHQAQQAELKRLNSEIEVLQLQVDEARRRARNPQLQPVDQPTRSGTGGVDDFRPSAERQ